MPTLFLLLLAVATYAQPQPPLQDQRDGKTYKTVKIGTQIWLAENLNYNAEGSKCFANESENCAKYGRLYSWETAMKSCPSGWHLPSEDEWQTLVDFAGEKVAGKKLKAKIGWIWKDEDYISENGNGTDDYGFSALPGGRGIDSNFYDDDSYGYWWSASGDDSCRHMDYRYKYVDRLKPSKTHLLSVRCIKD